MLMLLKTFCTLYSHSLDPIIYISADSNPVLLLKVAASVVELGPTIMVWLVDPSFASKC